MLSFVHGFEININTCQGIEQLASYIICLGSSKDSAYCVHGWESTSLAFAAWRVALGLEARSYTAESFLGTQQKHGPQCVFIAYSVLTALYINHKNQLLIHKRYFRVVGISYNKQTYQLLLPSFSFCNTSIQ